MAWIYELSKFNRLFKFAPEKFGAKIASNRLYYYNSCHPQGIEINGIISIDFILKQSDSGDYYCYVINTRDDKEIELIYNLLEGKDYQQLIKDLLTLNPSIKLSEKVQSFLSREIPIKPKWEWDFKVYKGSCKEKGLNILQDFPSLFTVIQLWIFIGSVLLIAGLVFMGVIYLTYKFGNNYSGYRIYSIVFSAIFLCIGLINLYAARYKLYYGNALTIIAFTASILLMTIGIVKF